jgi:ubiquinone/menaquinone biosynthesis C-methylase UbiE
MRTCKDVYENALIETIKRYDEISSQYHKDCRGKIDEDQLFHLNKFIKLLGKPPKKILDAGCGTGKDIFYLSSYGYELFGVDLSLGMLKEALIDTREKSNVHLLREDFRKTSYPDKSFDGVWCSASLVHLPHNEKKIAIEEFYRILKKGGILSIGIQNLLNMNRLFRILKSYTKTQTISFLKGIKIGYAYYDKRHWFYPTKLSLINLIKNTGFEILETNNIFSERLRIYARK